MTYDPVRANPLHGNPLRTRADCEKALRDLFQPLLALLLRGRRPGPARRRGRAFRPRGGGPRRLRPAALGPDPARRGRRDVRPLGPLPARPRQRHRPRPSRILGPGQRHRPAHGGAGGDRLRPADAAPPGLGAAAAAGEGQPRGLPHARAQVRLRRQQLEVLPRPRRPRPRAVRRRLRPLADRAAISRSSTASTSATAGTATATCAGSTTTSPSPCTSTGCIYARLATRRRAARGGLSGAGAALRQGHPPLVRRRGRHPRLRAEPHLSLRLRWLLGRARLRRPRGAALGRDQGSVPAAPALVEQAADRRPRRRPVDRLRLPEPVHVRRATTPPDRPTGRSRPSCRSPCPRTIRSGRRRSPRPSSTSGRCRSGIQAW